MLFNVPVIEFTVALSLFATCDAVHVLALHVDADPEAAVLEMVYPVLHELQSTVAVLQSVPPEPEAKVGEPFGQVHIFAAHVKVLKYPFVPQVAVPPPVYPEVQVIVTVSLVVPIERERKNGSQLLEQIIV